MLTPLRLAPLLFCLLAAPGLFAQQPITLDVVVTPSSGHESAPVGGLSQADFTVLDNDQPQPITGFHAGPSPQLPAEVILLVDAVNVPYTVVASERQQIQNFLRAGAGVLALPTTLVILTDSGLELARDEGHDAATRDGNALARMLGDKTIALRSIRRSAGFYGAEDRVDISTKALYQLAEHERTRPGAKIVLWVSPGWATLSGPGVQLTSHQQQSIFSSIMSFSAILRQARITLFAISPIGAGESVVRDNYWRTFLKPVIKPSQVDLGDLSLQVLAVQSGGQALYGNNDVGSMLRQAIAASSPSYELTFTPPPAEHPGQYHHLQIRLSRPGLVARTRQGYYDPLQPPADPEK